MGMEFHGRTREGKKRQAQRGRERERDREEKKVPDVALGRVMVSRVNSGRELLFVRRLVSSFFSSSLHAIGICVSFVLWCSVTSNRTGRQGSNTMLRSIR